MRPEDLKRLIDDGSTDMQESQSIGLRFVG
jgi:hypothetical protein